MDLGLRGRRAVITGSSKGLGQATAETLAAEGVDVHLVARDAKALERIATDLGKRHGVEASFSALDLSDSANVDGLFAQLTDRIDILVNNAGAIPGGSIDLVDEKRWREAWDLKVFGYINMCRLAYARMQKDGGGVIVNVIGAAGERPTPGYVAGAGGNASLMAITRALGGHSRQDGIRVVAINPGEIKTDRRVPRLKTQAIEQFGDASRWGALVGAPCPPGEPHHIADLVAFLASDVSSNTTGTVVTCDGGSCAR